MESEGSSSSGSYEQNEVEQFHLLLGHAREDKEQMEIEETAWTLLHMKNSRKETMTRGVKRRKLAVQNKTDTEETESNDELKTSLRCQTDQPNESGRRHRKSTTRVDNGPPISEEIMQIITNYQPPQIPNVPPEIRNIFGPHINPFEKQLSRSDIDTTQSRLAIKKKHMQGCIEPLLCNDDDLSKGTNVKVYDMEGKEYPMVFKKWGGDKVHVFSSGWLTFVKEKGLRHHEDFVTLWAFRHVDTNQLCFVMSSRRLPVHVPVQRNR